jgi:hypothetical protein
MATWMGPVSDEDTNGIVTTLQSRELLLRTDQWDPRRAGCLDRSTRRCEDRGGWGTSYADDWFRAIRMLTDAGAGESTRWNDSAGHNAVCGQRAEELRTLRTGSWHSV